MQRLATIIGEGMTPLTPLAATLDRKYGTGNVKITKIDLATFNSPVAILYVFKQPLPPPPGPKKAR